ncbi:hypothetical protein PIB30_115904, partial [Stylosanthes scabra]|nr:hypothetical protein [Stylosanthes scabra]
METPLVDASADGLSTTTNRGLKTYALISWGMFRLSGIGKEAGGTSILVGLRR